MLLYKGRLLKQDWPGLWEMQRAWNYGDGFFETIAVREGLPLCWEEHQQRMGSALHDLGLELAEDLKTQVMALLRKSPPTKWQTLKIIVWRNTGGRYTPAENRAEWLAYLEASSGPREQVLAKAGLVEGVRLFAERPNYKSLNSATFVKAARETQKKAWQAGLVVNHQNHLACATYGNLWWMKDNKLYTPALSTGCIDGTLRKRILAYCVDNSIGCTQCQSGPDTLREAEAVFLSNVWSLQSIADWGLGKAKDGKAALPFAWQDLQH